MFKNFLDIISVLKYLNFTWDNLCTLAIKHFPSFLYTGKRRSTSFFNRIKWLMKLKLNKLFFHAKCLFNIIMIRNSLDTSSSKFCFWARICLLLWYLIIFTIRPSGKKRFAPLIPISLYSLISAANLLLIRNNFLDILTSNNADKFSSENK